MHILVIIAFVIVSFSPERSDYNFQVIAYATATYITLTLLLGLFANSILISRKIKLNGGITPILIKNLMTLCIIAGHYYICITLGFNAIINELPFINNIPFITELLTLCPFLVAILVNWSTEFRTFSAIRQMLNIKLIAAGQLPAPSWTLRDYLSFNTRHQILFILVPLCFINILSQSVDMYFCKLFPEDIRETVNILSNLILGILIFIIAPMLIVKIWKTRSLIQGNFRSSLEEMCHRANIRFRDILIWESKGVLANAGAMGIIPNIRYILISDAVMIRLSPLEIRSVFGHELGHIRNHHILYLFLFAICSIFACDIVCWNISWTVYILCGVDFSLEFFILIMFILWFFYFGKVSKQFERQCDAYGAWSIGPQTESDQATETDSEADRDTITAEAGIVFTNALRKIVELNGVSITRNDWRHGRTSDRIEQLHDLVANKVPIKVVDAKVRRTKALILIFLGIGLSVNLLRYLLIAYYSG